MDQPFQKACSDQSVQYGMPLSMSQIDQMPPTPEGGKMWTTKGWLTPPIPNTGSDQTTSFQSRIKTAHNPLLVWNLPHFTQPYVIQTKQSGKAPLIEVALAHPEMIRHVLENKAGRYGIFPGSMHCHDLNLSDGMAANQPLMQSMSQFSSQALNSFFATMETEASLLADKLSASPLEGEMLIDPMIRDVINRMIQSTLLAQVPETKSRIVLAALDASLKTTGILDALKYLALPNWLSGLGARINQGPRTRLVEAVYALVASRRAMPDAATQSKTPDLISALISAFRVHPNDNRHDEQITNMVIAILSTCYATSHRTLVWALAMLACAPDIQQICANEARAIYADTAPLSGKIEDAHTIKAVINETLRLYPPVPVMRRTVLQDDLNHDLAITKGSTVLIAPWVLHRHSALWHDPHSFIPDRFLGDARRMIAPYTFLPFGGGEQTCIGFGYMMQATRLVLLALLNQLSVQYPARQSLPVPVQRVGLVPQSPISLIFRCRA